MEEDREDALAAYYYHHHHHGGTAANTNGFFSPPSSSSADPNPLHFPHSGVTAAAAPAPVPSEPVKRKRGRPRKYGTATAAAASPSPTITTVTSSSSPAKKAATGLSSSSSPLPSPASAVLRKKAQIQAIGKAWQGFTPHIITVETGEDVAQRILSFKQHSKHAVCILSASGSVYDVSLRQPAIMGGLVAYKGPFEIISLSGAFAHVEIRGESSRAGGLSVCLASTNGQIIGGGVGGPLRAAGPVQVIAASFLLNDDQEDLCSPGKLESHGSKLSTADLGGTTSVQSGTFRSTPDSVGRVSNCSGTDDHQIVGSGNNFMLTSQAVHAMPSRPSTDWRGRRGGGHVGVYQSQVDGDTERD